MQMVVASTMWLGTCLWLYEAIFSLDLFDISIAISSNTKSNYHQLYSPEMLLDFFELWIFSTTLSVQQLSLAWRMSFPPLHMRGDAFVPALYFGCLLIFVSRLSARFAWIASLAFSIAALCSGVLLKSHAAFAALYLAWSNGNR